MIRWLTLSDYRYSLFYFQSHMALFFLLVPICCFWTLSFCLSKSILISSLFRRIFYLFIAFWVGILFFFQHFEDFIPFVFGFHNFSWKTHELFVASLKIMHFPSLVALSVFSFCLWIFFFFLRSFTIMCLGKGFCIFILCGFCWAFNILKIFIEFNIFCQFGKF